ncbi:MAG: CRISPR-associated helicase Cas3', partial [Pseudomonadota bacterium]
RNDIRLRLQNFFEENDKAAALSFFNDLQTLFSQQFQPALDMISPLDLHDRIKQASWFLAGFVVLCDWIGSNVEWFRFKEPPIPLDEYWEKYALPQAEAAVRKAGVGHVWQVNEGISFNGVFTAINTPTPLQRFVAECPVTNSPQLFILEDITGSGKTEAALYLSRRLMAQGAGSGIFIALPTMATSNAMFDRLVETPSSTEIPVYQRLFDANAEPSIVLAHSARHLSKAFMNSITKSSQDQVEYEEEEETATAQCVAWLADNRKKALLADVGVGTLDQALLAILPSRFQSLRLFGLAGHILIIDEVHAYDPYMNKLLQNLLTFHSALGGSAILLSATLPQHTRQAMLDSFAKGLQIDSPQATNKDIYPLATQMSRSSFNEEPIEAAHLRKTSVVVNIEPDAHEVERLIVEASQNGKCVCWIRNTVYDALAAYQTLRTALPADSLILFHARFAMGDRLAVEKIVTDTFGKKSGESERKGKVLIATQVVEQSLDLDFDLLVSDLAPMDLLIQRAGRLHRHVRDERGDPLPADSGPDQREAACFVIHSPEPQGQAEGDWYKKAFPKAAYVYPSHGCLWLTAHLLAAKGALKMPEDARELIEAAFDEKADNLIPPLLRQRDLDAAGKWQADKSLAHINMLKLEEGYAATPNQWLEDMRTPTRLGEMETAVRLACWDGTKLTPWYQKGDFPWDMSQVTIRSNSVFAETEFREPALKEAVEKLKLTLPDKGKWSVLVPMTKYDNETWRGEALGKKGETVIVTYCRTSGVTVTSKEADENEIQFD